MIYTLAFYSKSFIQHRLSPQLDTFVIQLSNPGREIEIDQGFYGEHNVTFLDDAYPTYKDNILSIEQAKEITKILDRINNSSELLEVIICCDTGKTASPAVALFAKDRYPKAKAYQLINTDLINKNVLSTMKIATYKGVTLSGLDAGLQNLLDGYQNTTQLMRRISKRNFKNNAIELYVWCKKNF